MTTWEVAVIVGCAVIGFIVVSLIIEAVGWKTKRAEGPEYDKRSASSDESSR